MPQAGFFPVQIATLNSRHVLNFSGQPLKLADLTGASLKRLGAHAGLAGSGNYAVTQKWSAAIHAHPERVDGFIYMSRQLNTEKAVVLFDRSRSKIAIASKVALTACPGFARAAVNLGIIAS